MDQHYNNYQPQQYEQDQRGQWDYDYDQHADQGYQGYNQYQNDYQYEPNIPKSPDFNPNHRT